MIKKLLNNHTLSVGQFYKYFIIGGSGTILDILSLYLFKEFFNLKPVYAVIINQALMLNYIFFLNKYWTFKANGMTHQQMLKYYFLAGFNYLFSVIWMLIFNEYFLFNYLAVRLVNIALMVSWNFLIYKFWIFKNIVSTSQQSV